MINDLLKKYYGVAFLCESTKEFVDCVDFMMFDLVSPNIMSDDTALKNKIYIEKTCIPILKGRCFAILVKDADGYTFDYKNYDDFEIYYNQINIKEICYNKVLRQNKLKKLKYGKT